MSMAYENNVRNYKYYCHRQHTFGMVCRLHCSRSLSSLQWCCSLLLLRHGREKSPFVAFKTTEVDNPLRHTVPDSFRDAPLGKIRFAPRICRRMEGRYPISDWVPVTAEEGGRTRQLSA